MADLSVSLCGINLKNPVIAASGTYGFGREFNEVYDISVIGGVSMKGGRGKMICVLFGIFILAIVNNILNLMGVSAFLVNAIKGAIIIVAVLLQKKDRI